MPSQIIFPCPNCGASQSVDDTTVSTQCQFCGNTIAVPENLRPKPVPPDPTQVAPQSFSFGGATGAPIMGAMPSMGMTGMPGLPSMFQNMDLNKLRDMAMAARSGDTDTAARLYSEAFGVSPDVAMQAAQLMSQHHPMVLGQMSYSSPVIQMSSSTPSMQIGGMGQPLPTPRPGATYALPSPPITNAGRGSRWAACFTTVFILAITLLIFGIVAFAVLRAR